MKLTKTQFAQFLLEELNEIWWEEKPEFKSSLPDFATPERIQNTADKYERLFGHREGAPAELARSSAKLYELVAQELEKRMSGEQRGRITKADLTEAITAALNEHAKDYIWGTTNAPIVANQYGWRSLKGNCDE
tara:strand:- start:58 stop:459 length:402 start_codon:yes stop_codon:yes gene_type:complete